MTFVDSELETRLKRFQGFLAVDPANIPLQIDVGDLLLALERYGEAEKAFTQLLVQEPAHQVGQARLANVYIAQGRFQEAEAILRSLQATSEHSAVLNHNLGVSLTYQGHWSDALEALDRAEATGADIAANRYYKAFCLSHLNRREEALAMAASVLDLDSNADLRGNVAVFQMELGESKLAVETCEPLLAINPRNVSANVVLASWNLNQQEMVIAARQINIVLEQEPRNRYALLGLSLVHMYNLEFDAAIAAFQKTLEVTPRAVGTWVALGWAYVANNDLARAQETFEHTLTVDRTFGEGHGGLAAVHAMAGRTEQAKASIARAKGLNKNGFGAMYAVTILLEQEGKADVGARVLIAALNRSPGKGAPTLIESLTKYAQRQSHLRGQGARLPVHRGPVLSPNASRRF